MKEEPQKDTESNGEPSRSTRPSYDSNQIEELRKRLYSRNGEGLQSVRHTIPQREGVQRPVVEQVPVMLTPESSPVVGVESADNSATFDTIEEMPKKSKRKTYRKIFLLGGVGIFVLMMVASVLIMFTGTQTISGENISITTSGSVATGGGQEYAYQVTIANQNTVPILSATLIVEYPRGTRSVSDSTKEISIERLPLNTIASNELITVPLSAVMYGEENEEKEIKIRLEYRIAGSNATYEKHADSLQIKITTSPVVISFEGISQVPSGREVTLKLILQSNATTPLSDILVRTQYPAGFDFTSSNLDTSSGEDTWRFTTIQPNQKQVIEITGILTGLQNDVRRFGAVVGVSEPGSINALSSQLATAEKEIAIEAPLQGINMTINNNSNDEVAVRQEDGVDVSFEYTNTMSTTIYDIEVFAELSGNAFNESQLNTTGFYDSRRKTIVWDGSNTNALREIAPGQSIRLNFNIRPDTRIPKSPVINIAVRIEGNRPGQASSVQNMIGSANKVVKFIGTPTITSLLNYDEGPFTNTGPIPPVAERMTQYTYLLTATAGVNDLADAVVLAVLPQTINWLDLVTSGNTVTFNPTTRTMRWVIGNLPANTEARVGVQVSFVPSTSQIGSSPNILGTQQLSAVDRFTGTTVRVDALPLTTRFTNDPSNTLGVVQAP